MTTIRIDLPDALAEEVRRAGLLGGDEAQALFREAVRNRRLAKLDKARKNVAAAGIPPMTMEEIEGEIEADRAERRTSPISD